MEGCLKKHDRLDEIENHIDTCSDLSTLPEGTLLRFYRPHPEHRLTFFCPLFYDLSYGERAVDPEDMVGDVLHTGDMGCAAVAGGSIFQLLIDEAVCVLNVRRHPTRFLQKAFQPIGTSRPL